MEAAEDSLTPAQRADILLNRTNVALARSRRLIDSWLPPKPASGTSAVDEAPEDEDDVAFKSMSETAGVGSSKAYAVDEDGSGLRRRKGLTAGNERLLETILGRKGAREKMRSVGKGSEGGHEAAKKIEGKAVVRKVPQVVEEDDEDDEERAARFGGKKRRRVDGDGTDVENKEEAVEESRPAGKELRIERRRPVSYLDELLAGKKSKKSKKKQGDNADVPPL